MDSKGMGCHPDLQMYKDWMMGRLKQMCNPSAQKIGLPPPGSMVPTIQVELADKKSWFLGWCFVLEGIRCHGCWMFPVKSTFKDRRLYQNSGQHESFPHFPKHGDRKLDVKTSTNVNHSYSYIRWLIIILELYRPRLPKCEVPRKDLEFAFTVDNDSRCNVARLPLPACRFQEGNILQKCYMKHGGVLNWYPKMDGLSSGKFKNGII